MRLTGVPCPAGPPSYEGRVQAHALEAGTDGVERCVCCGKSADELGV